VQAGKRRRFERGEWSGGPAPDGYKVERFFDERNEACGRLVIDDARAAIVRHAFELAAQGHGDPAIAKRLNGLGHRTVRCEPFKRRTVQNMLTNPIYAGGGVAPRQAGRGTPLDWRA
jgi:hypothetical protein